MHFDLVILMGLVFSLFDDMLISAKRRIPSWGLQVITSDPLCVRSVKPIENSGGPALSSANTQPHHRLPDHS